jgi:hypothetical protein
MIWPWIELELAKIWELRSQPDAQRDAGMTAVAFLRMLKAMRNVLLQDAAAMLLQFPNRKNHCFFRHPLFLSDEFVAFCTEMDNALKTTTPEDATTAAIETVLPGINSRFDRVDWRFDRVDESGTLQKETIQSILGSINQMNASFCQFQCDVRRAANVLASASQTGPHRGQTEVQTAQTETQDDSCTSDGNNASDPDFEQAQRYVLVENFQSVQDMVDCWLGYRKHTNRPISGGLSECERRWKTKWRKHWDVNTDQKKLSRLKTIVLAVIGGSDRLDRLERFWEKTPSLSGLVKECNRLGYRSTPLTRRKSDNN